LKRCSKKECCKQCRHVTFKGTMTTRPGQKQTHRTAQNTWTPRRNRYVEDENYLCVSTLTVLTIIMCGKEADIGTNNDIVSTFFKLMYSWNVRTFRNVSQLSYSVMINRHDTTNAFASNWWYSVYMCMYVFNYLNHHSHCYVLAKIMYVWKCPITLQEN